MPCVFPVDARIVDGQGRFLLPGLVDFHTHHMTKGDMVLYVANGVTTIANMGSRKAELLLAWRDSIRRGSVIGPTIFAGYFVDGEAGLRLTGAYGAMNADTPERGRLAARLAKERGFDFLKVYNSLPDSAFFALADEAKRLGVPIAGHGVRSVGLQRGMAAGQRLIAHAEEFIYAFLGDSADVARIPEVAAVTKHLHASVIANLSAFQAISRQWGRPRVVDSMLAAPPARYLDPFWVTHWREDDYDKRPGSLGDRLQFLERLTKAFSDSQVPLLLGTDSPTVPGMLPGFSAHIELTLLVAAGLTPYQALVAGTRAAGDYVAREMPTAEPFGTIAPGMRADLLLVDANPLASVENLRRPAGVMVRGRWLSRQALDGLLAAQAR